MMSSKIEWCHETWNPVTGCTRVSSGCDNCYAVAMTRRLGGMKATKAKYGGLVGKGHFNGVVLWHEDALAIPLRWKKPRLIFVNSMSDLFHPGVPFEFIDKVFAVMALCPQHTFQVLTKRPERMAEYICGDGLVGGLNGRSWRIREAGHTMVGGFRDGVNYALSLPNVWLGTSVENQTAADERIPHLLKCPAAVRFLSCEPLLGAVELMPVWHRYFVGAKSYVQRLSDVLHWVIVGGESGPGARPMHPRWARSIRDQCVAAGLPFVFKQWGAWRRGNYGDISGIHIAKDGRDVTYERPKEKQQVSAAFMVRVGKKAAGRLLDGREWNEMPEVACCQSV